MGGQTSGVLFQKTISPHAPHNPPHTPYIQQILLMKSYIAPKVTLLHIASEHMMALSSHQEEATSPGGLSNGYDGSSIWDNEETLNRP